ncbi:hypothetical protein [Mucilaginibacter sp.]|uniref:hypothetical protein n=1 Tax=Mucilaginibacter sp. TaxID=1882438 RepID=UPI0026247E49|nr:hypothetical protein [Mucilaginibacter sp.]MDB4922258.1 hypothetical protein [Mucilaginibacter sp.]
MALLCSCENKNQNYSDKYDKILKDEELYIDSIGGLPYVGVTTMDRLASHTSKLDSIFNVTSKEHTADEYKPTIEQEKRHLELIKRTKFYIEGADLTKK